MPLAEPSSVGHVFVVLIERLTPADEIMLWPGQIWPQDIGALAILAGTRLFEPDGRFRIEAVRDSVASRLHLVPRLRQLLYVPSRSLGGPLWVDDAAFDVKHHVNVVSVPPSADEASLIKATEDLRRQRMDRSRPLWEMWLLTGMPNGRVGMFVRTHHSVADGIAGVATLGAFLDVAPDSVAEPAPPWTPAPRPTNAVLYDDAHRRRIEERTRRLASLARPVTATRHFLSELPALHELLGETGPSTSLDRRVGAGRTLALVRASLERTESIAHANGAKVNDVLLAAIGGGLRALLSSRGEEVPELRVYVPMSLRHGQYAGARGNSITQMVVPLPVGVSDPAKRLRKIADDTARRKAMSRPSVGRLPVRGVLGLAMLKLIERQRVNVETADLPGPPIPLCFAGAPVLEVFPLLPLIGRVSLGVGAMSYAGQFNIAAVADKDGYADIDVFATGVRLELEALATALPASAAA